MMNPPRAAVLPLSRPVGAHVTEDIILSTRAVTSHSQDACLLPAGLSKSCHKGRKKRASHYNLVLYCTTQSSLNAT